MDIRTMVVVLVLLAAIWWLLRKQRAASAAKDQPAALARRKNTPYHAVSIVFASNACNAAKAMAGRRFLATAPPKLPLPDCDVLQCSCRFAHHDDRRSGKERRSPFSPGRTIAGTGDLQRDKRAGGDRRRSDK